MLKVLMKRPCNGWRRLPAAESLQIRQPICTQQSKDSNFASMKANKQIKIRFLKQTDSLSEKTKKKKKRRRIGCDFVRGFSQLDGLRSADASANPPWLHLRIYQPAKKNKQTQIGFHIWRFGVKGGIENFIWVWLKP